MYFVKINPIQQAITLSLVVFETGGCKPHGILSVLVKLKMSSSCGIPLFYIIIATAADVRFTAHHVF